MSEIKKRKNLAEDLNNRIQDAIVIKKTRQRAGEEKKKTKDDEIDKEQQMRDLLEEAKQ
jgi:hypothetical protein